MTIVSLKTENFRNPPPKLQVELPLRNSGLIKLEFSNGTSLLLTADYLPEGIDPAVWETGRELSSVEEEAFRFAAVCYRAEKAAARLIARAEQSSFGITVKLERRGYEAAAVKAVVSLLSDRNLLNDERYAECWIRSRLKGRKAPSPRWLLVSLGKRGIDRASSLQALKNALDPETEYTLLLKHLKAPGIPGKNPGISLKSRLKYEGFSPQAVERYIDLTE